MIIDVFGKHKLVNPVEVQEAAEFFLRELIPLDKLEKLYLTVEVDYADSKGSAHKVSKNEYTITLSRTLGKRPLFATLAHEIVHVKQFVLGELRSVQKAFIWDGKRFPVGKDDDYIYFDSPWEIEAYGREVGLTHKYYRHISRKEN